LFQEHEFKWRGTPRRCRIQFENVRKQSLDSLKNTADSWMVIIDYPFDEETGHGPKDDIANIDKFHEEFPEGTMTLVIIPSFLGQQSLNALGRLVIINNILKGDNFKASTGHLSPADQQIAKTLLENQQSQLNQQMRQYLDNAYGISSSETNVLDEATSLEEAEHFQSLMPGFEPRPPAAANLESALEQLLGQALAFQFPGHPLLDANTSLSPSTLKKVFNEIEKACQAQDGRVLVEKYMRKDVRMIANPLKIGAMEETHFIIDHFWKDHFLKMRADTNDALTVDQFRKWIDQPKAMGLPKILENLIIMTFAAQTNRIFFDGDTSIEPDIEMLKSHFELKEMSLPSESDWENAIKRAGYILGVTQSPLLNAGNVAKFSDAVKAELSNHKENCINLRKTLEQFWSKRPDLDPAANRLSTARAAESFLIEILQTDGAGLVERLSNWKSQEDPAPADATMGTSIKKALETSDAITDAAWEVIDTAEKLQGDAQLTANRLIAELKDAMEADELVTGLKHKIKAIEKKAIKLIQDALNTKQADPPPYDLGRKRPGQPPEVYNAPKSRKKNDGKTQTTVIDAAEKDLSPEECQATFNKILRLLRQENGRIELSWRIYKITTDEPSD
jgi:hypothetical protein